MNIYSIGSDYENYRFLLAKDDECGVVATDGSLILQGWQPADYLLFKDPRRKTDKRKTDFMASCFHPGVLIIDGKFRDMIADSAKGEVEFLKVNTPEFTRDFYIANLIGKVHAIDDCGLSGEEFMTLFRTGEMRFDADGIGDRKIFRDAKYKGLYYCTPQFIDEVIRVNMTGLKFNIKGKTSAV